MFCLRLHRQRNRLSISDVARLTQIKPDRLAALERGDLSAWPHGLYAREWVRAYAKAVGLDPAETVDEFCRLFPHGDRRGRDTLREMAAIIGHQSLYQDEFRDVDRRRGPHPEPVAPTVGSLIARAAVALFRSVGIQKPLFERS